MELLIVGLDGLSFNMIDRFSVSTPALSELSESGVSGHLMSVDTPTTIPAWTSFGTGKDPGSHGNTNMITQYRDYSTSPSAPNTTDPAAYDLLEDSLFVNLPASAGRIPAAKGSMVVSAMLSKNKSEAVPEELKALDSYDQYVLDHDASLKVRPSKYLEHVLEIVDARAAFAREAFETHDPRVGFVLFSATDWAGHILGNLSGEQKQREFYQRIVSRTDERAGELAELADNVVFMSDHGFEYKHTNVHVNEWLEEQEYFSERSGGTSLSDLAVSTAKSIAGRSDRAYAFIRRVHNHIMGTSVGAALNTAATPDVEYDSARAWQLRYGCLYVNDDRFDHPTVDDPDALSEELRTELQSLTTADGDPLFRDVLLADEVYADPHEMAPDVIARPAPHCFPTNLYSPTGGYASPTDNYEHRYRGLFAAAGPAFTTGGVTGMSIVDVLPTVMGALDEPRSPHFDGTVRRDILENEPTAGVLSAEELPSPVVDGTRDESDSERDEAVEKRLEDLGYIE